MKKQVGKAISWQEVRLKPLVRCMSLKQFTTMRLVFKGQIVAIYWTSII